jgi:hypothetical protein
VYRCENLKSYILLISDSSRMKRMRLNRTSILCSQPHQRTDFEIFTLFLQPYQYMP